MSRILTSLIVKKMKHSIEIKMIKRLKLNLRFMLPSVSSLFLLETSISIY